MMVRNATLIANYTYTYCGSLRSVTICMVCQKNGPDKNSLAGLKIDPAPFLADLTIAILVSQTDFGN